MFSASKMCQGFLFLATLWTLGCSRQDEGERCSLLNADSDCEDDLVCTEAADLRNDDGVDRCCPPSDEARSDSRCDLKTTGGDGDGLISGGGQGGMSSEGGEGELDEACTEEAKCLPQYTCANTGRCAEINCVFPSDCPLSTVCGVQGVCRAECNANRDCAAGLVCSDQRTCVQE